MKKSTILNAIILFVEVFVFLVISLIFVLMYGIKLDNISYNNFNISKLYIKYDKELIVDVQKFTYENNNIDINVSLDYTDGRFLFDFKNIYYHEAKIALAAQTLLSYEEIQSYINNENDRISLYEIEFIYDKNIKPLYAKQLILSFADGRLEMRFDKPHLDGVDLSGSYASLYNLEDDITLELHLKSTSLLNKNLKDIIAYYGVTIPVTQYSGKNKIYTHIVLPLNHIIDTKVYVDVQTQKSSIDLYDKKFEIDNAHIEYKDNQLVVKSDTGKLYYGKFLFDYSNLTVYLKDKYLTLNGDISDEYKNLYQLNSVTNLNTSTTEGDFYIDKFQIGHYVEIDSKNVMFKLLFDENENTQFISKNTGVYYEKKENKAKVEIDNFDKLVPYLKFIDLIESNSTSKLEIQSNNDFQSFDMKIVDLHANINDNAFKTNDDSKNKGLPFDTSTIEFYDGYLQLKSIKSDYDYIKLKTRTNSIFYKSRFIDEKKNNFIINGEYNLIENSTDAEVILVQYKLDNVTDISLVSFDLHGEFDDNITFSSEYLELDYYKNGDIHKLSIENLDNLMQYIPIVYKNSDKQSSLKVFTNDNFKSTDVIVHNIEFLLNDKMFESDDNKTKTPAINIKAFDSVITYNSFKVDGSAIEVDFKKDKLDLEVTPYDKEGSFYIRMFHDQLSIGGDRLSSSFINRVINKNKFKGGKFKFTLEGTTKKVTGDIKVDKVYLQKVAVLNNLITFINTTPALYNPLLVLPTLYRMGQKEFKGSSYFIKKGNADIDIDFENKGVKLKKFFSRGIMMDFRGKGNIDFKNEKQDYDVDVIFLKDYSNFVKNIPVLNYIILGDDGNFVTEIDIKGDFEKQSFETHAVKNVSTGVLNVIKRTITLPLKIFDNDGTKTKSKDFKEIEKKYLE